MKVKNRDTNKIYEVVSVSMREIKLQDGNDIILVKRDDFVSNYFNTEEKKASKEEVLTKEELFSKLDELGFKSSNKTSLENKTYSKLSSSETLNNLLNEIA